MSGGNWKGWRARCAAAAFAFGSLLAMSGAGAQQQGAADVAIGQVAPLSGVLASSGEQIVLGGRIYFEAVNAQGA